MTEADYICASNLARLRVIRDVLGEMCATKDLSSESIQSFKQWTWRMVDRHHQKVEERMNRKRVEEARP